MTRSTDKVSQWLLEGDPAIRWQVLRDVVGAADSSVERERQKTAREGWGARLLAKQDPEGTWAGGLSSDGGLYSPKWISTTYTMLLLRDLGLPSTNRRTRSACTLLLDQGLQRDGGINFGWTPSETCITGMVLSILCFFEYNDDRLEIIADHLQNTYKGKTYFEMERLGGPSRWNTLRALRVLKWWDGDARPEQSRVNL